MKLLFIDLDGVVADFVSAMNTHPKKEISPYDEHPDTIPHIFRDLKPIKGAIKAVNILLDATNYNVYFLSTAPWDNPSAWTDKRLWIEEQFGEKINRRLILTHRKDLMKEHKNNLITNIILSAILLFSLFTSYIGVQGVFKML